MGRGQLWLLVLSVCRCCAWQEWMNNSGTPVGQRDGHTTVIYKDELLVVFGGRSNEVQVEHIPKTFEIQKVNGTRSFKTYDEKVVYPCDDGTYEECYTVQTGRFYNDLWILNTTCARGWDTNCLDSDWRLLEGGASLGGCVIYQEVEYCTHPHERFGHASAVFGDGTLMLYGGYSRMCEDYCSDVWTLPLAKCLPLATPECKWTQLDTLEGIGPGARWRMASVHDDTHWIIFGGFRLWHGFAPGNTIYNNWGNTDKIPYGGYMDDLWIMRYNGTVESLTTRTGKGWKQLIPRETCFDVPPSSAHDARFDAVCTVIWPRARASSAITLYNRDLFLFGGYNVKFPYPQLLGRGAGNAVAEVSSDSPSPFPSLPYFLDDLWRYDFRKGIWQEVRPLSWKKPGPRFGHTLVTMGAMLLLFGGTHHGNFLGDLWYYHIAENKWAETKTFVHPVFPDTCTSDVVLDSNGDEIVIQRSVAGEPTRKSLLDGQDGRLSGPLIVPQPRRRAPGWDGCRNRLDGRTDLPAELQWVRPMQRAYHTAVVRQRESVMLVYGGEATQQEMPYSTSFSAQTWTVGDLWYLNMNHCVANCSSRGACVNGHCICNEGWYGSDCSNATCPGTVCYYDMTTYQQQCLQCMSLPYVPFMAELLRDPEINQADRYKLLFNEELGNGGTFDRSTLPKDRYQMFYKKTQLNFTSMAVSEARRRLLFDMYEGAINTTVEAALDAGSRLSHGICDGFGQCQCRPPFLGTDCSILDCPNACSGHGWCSIEYPVSRCMCTPPYAGLDCSRTACPNNCSYPNGHCDKGHCECQWALNPYNKTQRFAQYGGDDCSFQMPFASVAGISLSMAALLATLFFIILVLT